MYRIMIVDDNKTNLIMAKKALEDTYDVIPMSSGVMALEFLKDMPEPPDILLLDVDIPDINGFYVISEVKNQKRLEDMPVIFLTAQDDDATEIEGYSLGAVDYITKPYTTMLLRKRIDIHVQAIETNRQLKAANKALADAVNNRTHNVIELEYAIVEMFASLMGHRSNIIEGHSRRVENYMTIFIDELSKNPKFKIEEADKQIIVFASKIHDIGKICMTDRCLADMGDLSLQEKEFNHAHTILGAEAIKKVTDAVSANKFLTYAYNMCRSHHERWDGKGYPDKLMSTNIPFEARVLAIVNSYDNFRTNNDGQEPMSHREALTRIKFWAGTHFDPELSEIFVALDSKINA
ncbi:MAG: response regulator [Lachnospiraceae bacterium]|nr:response regulator [Lachnospiraceae bacterium]